MGDREDRARAIGGLSAGVVLALLSAVATIALAIAIPTQGENPRAWGVIGCGAVTVVLCIRLAIRNWRLLRHYRGADLPPSPAGHGSGHQHRHQHFGLSPAHGARSAAGQARAKAAR